MNDPGLRMQGAKVSRISRIQGLGFRLRAFVFFGFGVLGSRFQV